MAKLIALALAFSALVAFATAHTTIFTTTIEDENPISRQRQCSQRLEGQRLNQCRMYLQQGQRTPYEDNHHQKGQQQQDIQQCCQELQNVDEQCQCEAVKQVFRYVQQQQQGRHQIGPFGSQQTQWLKQKAERLPNQCNLQSRRCQIGSIMTTITTIDESNTDVWPFGSRSPSRSQCSQSEMQRPVNQCQRYVQQQISSPRTLLMSINRQGHQHEHVLQQCCNELLNMERECQCQAIKEVARKAIQQQQGGRSRFGGQQEEQTEIVWSVVQNLPNQCQLDVKQCNIPY